MRLYYVGKDPDHTDPRLPGLLLNYGNAVDVYPDDLAEDLLALSHWSSGIVAARPVEIVYPAIEAEDPGLPEEVEGDVLEEHDDLEVDE